MDTKAVLKNLRNKGLRETWAIHSRRKKGQDKSSSSSQNELERRIELLEKSQNKLTGRIHRLQERLRQQERLRLQEQVLGLFEVELPMTEEQFDAWIDEESKNLESQSLELMAQLNDGDDVYSQLQFVLGKYYTLMDLGLLDRKKDAHVREFLGSLATQESKPYIARLRKEYVQTNIPEAYKGACVAPILEKKAVFLQPRLKMNQAFSYMYRYLSDRGYSVRLYELGLDSVPKSLYYWNAVNFAKFAATAKVIFVHESNELLGHTSIRPETKVVQLWHGCGVFKKIGLDTMGLPGLKSKKGYEDYPEYNYYSCVTIASPDQSWVFERFMGIDKSSGIIKPLGVSRTDCFFDQDYIDRCYEKLHERIPASRTKKVILYAPTYRGVGKGRYAPDVLDIEAMARHLSDEYVLIVKHHQTIKELPALPESVKGSFAFDMTRGAGMDISELMTVSDICISDYSSLVCEYSLFERPMAFFVYDLEDYIDERGLYYDFSEITPGPLCKTTDELIDFIENIDSVFDREKVIQFKNKFMSSCDGHATERIVRYIEGEDF